MAQLIINCKLSWTFKSLIKHGYKPRVFINGVKNIGSFSNPNTYDLKPGINHIKVYCPNLFPSYVAQITIDISEGDFISIEYSNKSVFAFIPGSLEILSHEKGMITNESSNKSTHEAINVPDFCPLCKSPNTKKIRLCEWCGNQIC